MSVVLRFTAIEFSFLPFRQGNQFRGLVEACPECFDDIEFFIWAKVEESAELVWHRRWRKQDFYIVNRLVREVSNKKTSVDFRFSL
jgi:hypothetical protein